MADQQDPVLAGIDRLRDTAKWLIGAYAAVGTVLVAGLQLTSLGKVEDHTRLWAGVLTAFAALVAVIVGIWKIAGVLAPVTVQQSDLAPGSKADQMVRATPSLLKGQAPDLATLQAEYSEALRDYQSQRAAARADPTKKPDAEATYRQLMAIHDPLDGMRRIALFEKVQKKFDDAKRVLGGAALLTVACVIAFGWAANPSEPSEETAEIPNHGPTLEEPSAVTISISKVRPSLRLLRAQLGVRCDLTRVRAFVVGGTASEPDVVTLPQAGCNAVRFAFTQEIGFLLPASKAPATGGK